MSKEQKSNKEDKKKPASESERKEGCEEIQERF